MKEIERKIIKKPFLNNKTKNNKITLREREIRSNDHLFLNCGVYSNFFGGGLGLSCQSKR